MDLDLRQAIFRQIGSNSEQDLREIVDDSIGAEEKVLPGLGVVFELIWEHSEEDTRQQLIATLYNALKTKA